MKTASPDLPGQAGESTHILITMSYEDLMNDLSEASPNSAGYRARSSPAAGSTTVTAGAGASAVRLGVSRAPDQLDVGEQFPRLGRHGLRQ
jgi:hypothetical protein